MVKKEKPKKSNEIQFEKKDKGMSKANKQAKNDNLIEKGWCKKNKHG